MHLMLADLPCEAVSELCDFEALCARLRCGDGYTVVAQLGVLLLKLRTLNVVTHSERIADAIAKADHFRRWLKRDMAVINDAPERELLASCSEQPFSSVVRQSVVPAMLSSSSAARSINESSLMLSVVIGRSLPDFDECEAVLRGHTACVRCVAWGSSSAKCASGSDDGSIRVWVADTGAVEVVLTGHRGSVRSVAWGLQSTLASGGKDKTVRLWDIVTAKLKETLEGHLAEVNAVAWGKSTSKNGAYLASGSSDKTIRLWDTHNQPCSCIRILHVGAEVLSVACAPDGWHIAAGTDDDMRVYIFSVQTWKCSMMIQEVDGVNNIAYSPSGDSIASCTGNFSVYGTVNIWSTRSGKRLRGLKGNAHSINSITWSTDGNVIATASWDKFVRVWDAKSCEMLKQFTGHSDSISCVQFSNDGSRLASASHDRSIRVYDVTSFTNPVGSAAHIPDETHATGDVAVFGMSEDAVTDLCWSPDGNFIASASQDATVRVWASRTGHQAMCVSGGTDFSSRNTDEVLSVSFSADGSFVASACADGSVRLFDISGGAQLHLFHAHNERATCVRISPEGFVMASSSKDKSVKLWGVGSRLQLHALQGHTEEVRCVAWSPDSKLLASGADDHLVHIWNVHSGEAIQILRHHFGGIFALEWAPKGDFLASR
jgi:WD40 repeat protein